MSIAYCSHFLIGMKVLGEVSDTPDIVKTKINSLTSDCSKMALIDFGLVILFFKGASFYKITFCKCIFWDEKVHKRFRLCCY